MKDRNRRNFVHILELDRNIRINHINIHLIGLEKPRLHWFPIFVVILQIIRNIDDKSFPSLVIVLKEYCQM